MLQPNNNTYNYVMQLMTEPSGRFAHGFSFLSDRGYQCFFLDSLTPLVALDSV